MVSFWSPEEDAVLRQMLAENRTDKDISEAIPGRTRRAVKHRRVALGLTAGASISSRERAQQSIDRIRQASQNPQIDPGMLESRIRELEAEVAVLREQKKWEQHADLPSASGGLLTLRESDRHNGDENHLLGCAAILEDKFCLLLERYQPDRLQHIAFDDWICGRGIFREQDLQSAVPDPEQQIAVGAVKARRFYQKIRKVTQAPIHVTFLRGNHEMAPGKTSLGNYLFLQVRAICEDIPGITFTQCNDRAIVNLADTGKYNVLAMHGFGHSNISPNSPAFVSAAKDFIIQHQRKVQPGEHIRRVLSGHTHYLSVGLERIVDLPFDTTGGLQRNNRVQLGMNSRPVGWIVYSSPGGSRSEIAQPIELKPDTDAYERELRDVHLPAANRIDCGECLKEYADFMRARGLLSDSDEVGVTGGRW